MPITQSRMLSLLSAAQDYAAAFAALRQYITALTAQSSDPREIITEISSVISEDYFLSRPVETKLTIAREAEHFSPARTRENDRRKTVQAQRRQNNGSAAPYADTSADEFDL